MAKFISLDRLSEFKTKLLDLFVQKSGDTMTGNLTVGSAKVQTNGYIVGAWLQATANNASSSKQPKICVQDSSGWIYSRTPEQILSDIGGAATPTVITGTLSAGNTSITLSNSAITTDSVIDIYTSVYGVNPTAISVSAGSITLTFDAQSSAVNIRIEVK